MDFNGPMDQGYQSNLNMKVEWHLGMAFVGDFQTEMRSRVPPGATVFEQGLTEIDGKKTFFAKSSYTKGGRHLVKAQYFTLGKGKLYTLTLTCTRRSFPRHSRSLPAILASLRIE